MAIRGLLAQFLNLIAVAAVCAGCASIGRADNDASLTSPDDTFYVIGVAPETTAISLFRGSIAGGVFHQNPLLPTSFMGTADDGFIVSRTHANETLAITYIALRQHKDDPFGRVYVPCSGSKTLVFTAPAGKVIYLGDVQYLEYGSGIRTAFGQNFEAAKAYMASHYPKLADKLEPGEAQFLPATGQGQCAGQR